MKSFEERLEKMRETLYGRPDWYISVEGALEALAAERAAERERPKALDPLALWAATLQVDAEPRSYSHWGMH